MGELDLKGKVAVITGAARGIGRKIAETYLAHGARVVIGDLLEEVGRATARELGKDTVFQRCDVADPVQARELVQAAVRTFGTVDILVNNAAYNPTRAEERVTIDEYPEEVFRKTVDVDINGTFYCSREASRHMKTKRTGSILSIASVAGVVAFRNQIAHVACKAAIIRMGEAMALELGPHGIRVNTISPGSTVTDATRSLFYGTEAAYKERAATLLSFIPVGRPAEVEDMANAALFLASDLSAYITGHNLVVDGGWTSGYSRNF